MHGARIRGQYPDNDCMAASTINFNLCLLKIQVTFSSFAFPLCLVYLISCVLEPKVLMYLRSHSNSEQSFTSHCKFMSCRLTYNDVTSAFMGICIGFKSGPVRGKNVVPPI